MNLARRAVDPLAGGFQGLMGSNRWCSTKDRGVSGRSPKPKPIYEPIDRRSLSSLLQALGHDES